MGNVAGYRAAFIAARDYKAKWDKWREDGEGSPPTRNLQNETLAGVLDGSILIQNHCYRADEMAVMIDIAKEFGYKITAFHHAVEAYKIAPHAGPRRHLRRHVDRLVGLQDGEPGRRSRRTPPWSTRPERSCAVIHSDDAELTQRLNQEAAAALAAGRRIGHEHLRGARDQLDHPQRRPARSASPTRPARWRPANAPTS